MKIEIINTGSELMLGFVLNTHQQWLCRQLADLGYPVTRQIAVPDTGSAIQDAAREALARADLVITTGGLGPTSDDMTRDYIAALLGRKLQVDKTVLKHVEDFFSSRGRPMPPNTAVQALVPDGTLVLPNAHGTAPGLVLEIKPGEFQATDQPRVLIMLPGPPRELRPMFTDQVIPFLRHRFPSPEKFVCRTLITTGLGESVIQEKIASVLQPLTDAGLQLGYCARIGEVDIRLVARGPLAQESVNEAEAIIRSLIEHHIFGTGDESLEAVVVRLLIERKRTVVLAESCTGGYIANRLTNISGASAVVWGGMVTYSNDAKQSLLGVRPETLAAHGAVSESTAREMAEGARQRSSAAYAIAVTGIAGPTGGTPDKPVGTVFIALAAPGKTKVLKATNPYDRKTFKFVTSQQALEMLRRSLLSEPAVS